MHTKIHKPWKAGVADEVWKVIICGRDMHRIDDLLSALSYYLTGGSGITGDIAKVRQMTGEQIISGLEAYKDSCLQSVKNGLRRD